MVIVWEKGSGLCNRLFVSAYGLSLATAAGQKLINFRLDDYESLFPAANRFGFLGNYRWGIYKIARAIIRRSKRLPFLRNAVVHFSLDGRNSAAYSPGNPEFVEAVKSRAVTFVEGWPHLEKMTFPHAEIIRDTFTPAPDVLAEVAAHVRAAKQGVDFLIGVHIRRGDYENHLDGKYNYSSKQYFAAMEKTAELLAPSKVAFLVCSNAVQHPEDFHSLKVTFGPANLLGDLYSLASCDYLIGPPSTFSLWAAFYGRVPFYCLMHPDVPSTLKDFMIPDGHYECMRTVMDTEDRE